jgi:hypothetical protein
MANDQFLQAQRLMMNDMRHMECVLTAEQQRQIDGTIPYLICPMIYDVHLVYQKICSAIILLFPNASVRKYYLSEIIKKSS